MEIIQLTELSAPECITKAVEVLQRGGVIMYPTDTLYGLGADALSNAAVDVLYKIKGREEKKPIHCMVSDLNMAERYAQFEFKSRALAKQFMPGPLTLVLKKQSTFDTGITRDIATIGIRIPNSNLCLDIERMFRKPVTTTSANVSGKPCERTVPAILQQLGDSAREIDLVIDAGELPGSLPSTVVDMSGEDPVILREGAIPASDIWQALGPVLGNLGI